MSPGFDLTHSLTALELAYSTTIQRKLQEGVETTNCCSFKSMFIFIPRSHLFCFAPSQWMSTVGVIVLDHFITRQDSLYWHYLLWAFLSALMRFKTDSCSLELFLPNPLQSLSFFTDCQALKTLSTYAGSLSPLFFKDFPFSVSLLPLILFF